MKQIAPRSVFLIFLLFSNLCTTPAFSQGDAPKLNIVVVEGEGAINNVNQRVTRESVVRVEDANQKPIAGASVVFFLPSQGPGGIFPNGSQTLTTTTNTEGLAVARGIRYNNQSGTMQIRVTASSQGATGSAVITQSNVIGNAASGHMSTTTKIILIAALVGAAAAAGILATSHGSSSSSGTPTVTITPGTPTVGAP